MKLNNPFSTETRWLFFDYQMCWICGSNGNGRGGLELHHIVGRDSSSPFNAAVLDKECHEKIKHTEKEESELFTKTFLILKQSGYNETHDDNLFIAKWKHRLFTKQLEQWLKDFYKNHPIPKANLL